MRVLLLTRYGPLGSTSRLRFYQFLPFLQRNGVQIDISPLLADDYVRRLYAGRRQPVRFLVTAYVKRLRALFRAGSYDLIWVEKEFLPWLPAFAPVLMKTPYVADYDDAAFHRYDLHRSVLVRRLLGRKIDRVMAGAALVVAGNEYLAARARQAGAARVEIVPTVIAADRYTAGSPPPAGTFRMGWIGAPVTAHYLLAIEAALKELLSETGVSLTIVGAQDPFAGRLPVNLRPWAADTEVGDIGRFDVGIMPLPDEPFERGKCGYKLVQYMGCSLPVVASPVGVNAQIVEPGINGFLAASHDEWVSALRALRLDPGLRARLGSAGRQKVESGFNLSIAAPRLLSLLQSLTTR